MAKISNTTSYPFVQPDVNDYVIGTAPGATPSNQTSNFKLGDIANLNPQDLQSVLSTGNIASLSIRLTDNSGQNELTLQSNNIAGQDFLQINTQNPGSDMEVTAQSRLTLFGDVTTLQGASSVRITSEPSVDIETEGTLTAVAGSGANAGTVVIGNDAPLQVDTTRMEFSLGGIKIDGLVDFKSDNAILLNSVPGAVGQTIVSQGPGSPLAWGTALPALTNTNVYTGDVNNNPVVTSVVTINSTNGDVKIGNGSGALQGVVTLEGKWFPEIYHQYGTNNVSLGVEVMADATLVGEKNTAIGTIAGNGLADTAGSNTLVGYAAGASITVANGNTLIGREADVNGPLEARGTAVGTSATVSNEAVALGSGSSAEKGCIAIGYNANAETATGANPVINFTHDVIDGLIANGQIYATNADALVDLNPGDIYLLDNATIGIPTVGGNNGPAIMCMVYTA